MDVLAIVLRIVHIASGVLWVGGAALFFFYIEPSINKLGPAAEPFVTEMIERRKAPRYFLAVSTLAVVAGVTLYVVRWLPVATTLPGLTFGIGGLTAIVAWIGGNLLIPRALEEFGTIGGQMKSAGGPPSAELMGRMHAVQKRLRTYGLLDLILLLFAVAAMAAARFMG